MNVKDPLVEPLFFADVDSYAGLPTRSFLCVPIHGSTPAAIVSSQAATLSSSGSTVMACLQVVNKRDDHHFSETDTALLTSLAMLAGQAMTNAAAYEEAVKRRKQQERLLTMIQHMNADTGIDKLLFNVVDAASHLISLSRVSLYVMDDSTRTMVCKVSNDKGTVGTRVPLSPPEGLVGHCVASGNVINIGGGITLTF
jgi:signal transduction protein with GAF and PtsI domain